LQNGQNIVANGVVLELPGFIIDILSPQTPGFVDQLQLKNDKLKVKATVVMRCDYTISEGGIWDGNEREISVLVKRSVEIVGDFDSMMRDIVNIFEADIPMAEKGSYGFIVLAFDAKTGNTGVDKLNFVLD
jgi:hypothetical protein